MKGANVEPFCILFVGTIGEDRPLLQCFVFVYLFIFKKIVSSSIILPMNSCH